MFLPPGALAAATLDEPYCYLSALQTAVCARAELRELIPHLPCWVPQRVVSQALFGEDSLSAVGDVTRVHGTWVWATEFSNVHSRFVFEEPPILVEGVQYPSVEACFQLAKSEGLPGHSQVRAEMLACQDPARAFAIGRSHGLRRSWESVKLEVMRKAVTAKFTQHPELADLLLSTGEHPLVQLKPEDSYWGTGSDGRGRNALGRLLMELRTELRAKTER